MAEPITVVIRFKGDSEELLERFERARRMWIEAQDDTYERPSFYAACRTAGGIVVVSAWQTAPGHRVFGEGMHSHLDAVGMKAPDQIERMRIGKLGWS